MTKGLRAITLIVFCLSMGSMLYADESHKEPAVVADLSFKQGALQIHATLPTKPIVGEESFIVLEAKNPETQEALEIVETVDVALWMPDMGHGSAPTTVEKALNDKGEVIPGVYHVREVYFTMGGTWEVNVSLTDLEGKVETQTFTVKLKGGHHH